MSNVFVALLRKYEIADSHPWFNFTRILGKSGWLVEIEGARRKYANEPHFGC